MLGVNLSLLSRLLLNAGIATDGIAAPTLDITLTSSLDSRITFTRAGSRNAIVNGQIVSLAANAPAFESAESVPWGLAVEPPFTNYALWSNSFGQSVWSKGNMTPGTGDLGPDGVTSMFRVTNTTATAFHQLQQVITTRNAGERGTLIFYTKPAPGATHWGVCLHMSKQYGNIGSNFYFRTDGTPGQTAYFDTSMVVDAVYGHEKLANGIYRVWVTGTWVTSSWKELDIAAGNNNSQGSNSYAGAITEQYDVWGSSYTPTDGPVGHVITNASTASQAGETAIFNDTSWLPSTVQGTFVVEHDRFGGTLIGSGPNTVVSAGGPGKVAFAWDGTGSTTVHNGGVATAGATPTFSGTDIRLLATTLLANPGHIKSIRFYPVRLSVDTMTTLTAKTVVSTAVPGSLRFVSLDNYLPREFLTTSGTLRDFVVRVRTKLGNYDVSELVAAIPNFAFPGDANTNDIQVVELYLEKETGGALTRQVKFAGANSQTVVPETAGPVLSDTIYPSDFGLTKFDANTVFHWRVRYRVSTAGHKFPVGQYGLFAQYAGVIDPAATTVSPLSGTGNISTISGPNPSFLTYVNTPILLGKAVDGDPKTMLVVGDSITGGTTTGSNAFGGSYLKRAAEAIGMPLCVFALGGSSQVAVGNKTLWHHYINYARVMADAMGTNQGNTWIQFFPYFWAARVRGIGKIIKIELFPSVTTPSPNDNWVSEATQITFRAYPNINFPDRVFQEFVKYGYADELITLTSARGVTNAGKWYANGTPNYSTYDGTHLSAGMDIILGAELAPKFAAITVS